jgi:ribosomal protein S18 acetylase RimI-like enzyme
MIGCVPRTWARKSRPNTVRRWSTSCQLVFGAVPTSVAGALGYALVSLATSLLLRLVGASVSRANVRVRPAELADVPALVALADSMKLGRFVFAGRPAAIERSADVAERFADLLVCDRRTVLAAFDDAGEALGMVVILEEELAPMDPTPVLYLSHLVVAPNARRHGIGRSLLAATVRLADERDIIHVVATATSSSREANRYLARLGFAPLVIRRIASTAVLHRSLGIADVPDRLALRRRLRAGRGERPARASAAARALGRGI